MATQAICWGIAALLTTCYATLVLYRVFFHPLSRYPGPVLARVSSWSVYAAIFRGNRTLYYHGLLAKHGSPFRIATNQLLFADEKSWDDIYGQSSTPCLKDPSFYRSFTVTGAVNVLNATDRVQAARLRRLLSHAFAKQTIVQSEEMISQRVETLIDVAFRPFVGGPMPVEIRTKIHEHYLHIISHLSFGRSLDCFSGLNPGACHDVNEFFSYLPAVSFFPLIKYLPIKQVQQGLKGIERLRSFSLSAVASFIEENRAGIDPKTGGGGGGGWLLKSLVEAVHPETSGKLAMEELIENTVVFLVAGEGTTAVTTMYALWERSRHPDIQAKLTTEIRHAFPMAAVASTYEIVSSLVCVFFLSPFPVSFSPLRTGPAYIHSADES